MRYGKEILDGHRNPFRVLISCILSQRTREENTEAASRALFRVASTPRGILKLSETKLRKIIKIAGFSKQKAKRIRLVSKIILTKHRGRVPKSYEKLLESPGVGPKTASVTLCYGFNIPCIPVDTHVNRISRRLGFVKKDAKIEEVEPILRRIFRKKDWRVLNRGLVLFGREICLPRFPKCHVCPVNRLCPTGAQRLKNKETKIKRGS